MKRPVIAVLIAVLFCQPAFLQISTPDAKAFLENVSAREYGAVVEKLLALERSDQKAFSQGDLNYLLARMAEVDGQLTLAMAEYLQAAHRDPLLKPYALAHLSRIARGTGNLMLERLWLLELTAPLNNGLLTGPARRRLVRNYFESGNYAETITMLSRGAPVISARLGDSRGQSRAETASREDLLLLGEAQLRSGLGTVARQTLTALTAASKNVTLPDDISAQACLLLDELDVGTDISQEEHLVRARIYQADRKFSEAKEHFEKVVTANGPIAGDALFQIGRGLSQQNEFAAAARYFNRVIDQYPQQPSAKDAMLQSASAQARLGNADEAIKRYQQFIDAYPTDEKLDRAYLNIVDVLRDTGADNDALGWCARTRAAFAGKLPANLATFTEARIYIAREDWQKAIERLNMLVTTSGLGGAAVPGGTTVAEVTFLKGFCLEQLGKYGEAFEIYLSIPDGRDSYYGWRASERIAGLARSDVSRPATQQELDMSAARLHSPDALTRLHGAQVILRLSNDEETRDHAKESLTSAVAQLQEYRAVPGPVPSPSRSTTDGDPKDVHISIATKLLALDLYDEAAPELEAGGKDPCEVAAAYRLGDRGDKAIEFMEPVWQKKPADFPIELIPDEQLQMLYPVPYADLIRRYAAERGLDPRFLLAVMKQESGFDPDARSGAAAGGLMQFISSTADRIASELGRPKLEPDDLFHPPTSILLGSQYIADLFRIFPDNPEAVAAAYNGGEDNAARWLARSRTDLSDRYVPEIMYAQSKDYVYRVMANYRMYRLVYDVDLRPIHPSAVVKLNAPCTRPAGG